MMPRLQRPLPRRVRVVLWRLRRPLAAVLVALAVVQLVNRLTAPPEPTVGVLVACDHLGAGVAVTGANACVTQVPRTLVPAGAPSTVAEVAGRSTAVDVPSGLPLVDAVLDRPVGGLPAPDGTVVAPVRLADAGLAELLSVGDRIDVFRPGESDTPTLLATRAMVVQTVPGTSGLLVETNPLVLVAVTPAEAAHIAAAATGHLTAILVR